MTVYIANSFGSMSGKEWAHERFQENPQSNVLIVAFDVTKRTQGGCTGGGTSAMP